MSFVISIVLNTVGILLLGILAIVVFISCAAPNSGSGQYSWGGNPASVIYFGQTSLEETIASADAIARVRLRSVSTGTARWDAKRWDEEILGITTGDAIRYVGTLEHRFAVQEYLLGTGDSTVTAIVYEASRGHESTGDATVFAQKLFSARDNSWDNREAIVFLYADYTLLVDYPKAGYYVLGSIQPDYGYNYGDRYSIASVHSKQWLPEVPGALGGSGSRSSTGNKRFLLDVPTDSGAGASGASGTSGSSSTITLASLKFKIGEFEHELDAGGSSAAYRACIYAKRVAERRVREHPQGFKHPQFTRNETVRSGLPAGSLVYPDDYEGDRTPRPPGRRVMELRGDDSSLFIAHNSRVVDIARPLPAGEFRFYEEWRDYELVICDGEPEEMERDVDVIIAVNAPEGTVHEAFFDPADLQDGVGFSADGGVLEPSRFNTLNTDTEITDLAATGDMVTMTLMPYVDLTFDTLDFIALDGSVAVSLSDGTGDATAGTITWEATAPWSSGDQLMLRIVEGEGRPN